MKSETYRQLRAEQAVVLLLLRRHRGRQLTTLQICQFLNRGIHATSPARVTELKVECALAALMLRGGAGGRIVVATRPATRAERRFRSRLAAPLLASTVLVAACAAPPLARLHAAPDAAHARIALAGYFGGQGVVRRHGVAHAGLHAGAVQPRDTMRLASGSTPATGFVPTPPTPKTLTDAPEGVATPVGAVRSYFDETWLVALEQAATPTGATDALYAPRAEANVWQQGRPKPDGDQVPTPDVAADRAAISALLAATLEPAEPPRPARPESAETVLAGKKAPSQASGQPPTRLISWYDDHHYVLPFSNGSQQLQGHAQQELREIARRLPMGDTIVLRGRVGRTVLTPEGHRLAIGRALAVRKKLLGLGVERERIRIHEPREADLLEPADFTSPLNLSASLFVRPGGAQQI